MNALHALFLRENGSSHMESEPFISARVDTIESERKHSVQMYLSAWYSYNQTIWRKVFDQNQAIAREKYLDVNEKATKHTEKSQKLPAWTQKQRLNHIH